MLSKPVSRAVAAALSVSVACAPPAALAGDLNAEVNDMFNSLGAVGNYTAPGAFRGQAMNMYSGGSLMMRTPIKSYRFAYFEPPSFKGSCGGIDAFGGSFSLISGSELKDMLANITAALPGIAFQLAVEAVSPLFGSMTKYFKDFEAKYNISSRNSCELATSLVSKVADATNFSTDKACRSIAVALNIASDASDAERRCATNKESILAQGRASADPKVAAIAPFMGNMTWKALSVAAAATNEEREIIMSLVGTAIYKDGYAEGEYIYPTITKVKELLYGHAEAPGSGGKVVVKLLKCNNYVLCDEVTPQDYELTSFAKKVRTIMENIANKIQSRQAFANPGPEIGFVNQTAEPVYKMLSIGTATSDPSVVMSLINRYGDVIAADHAYYFLDRYLRLGMQALSKTAAFSQSQDRDARRIQNDALSALALLNGERQSLYSKLASVDTISGHLEQLERQMRANSPNQVVELLGRSSSYVR